MEETSPQNYRINLDIFEGPLDLLLHLIKKNDLDIVNIPISKLLDEYLEYLALAKELNIDIAGDFILMASELTHIKSKILLPEEKGEDEEEGPDPREELMRKLLEYQRYKEVAQELGQRNLLGREVFHKPIEKEKSDLGIETVEADTLNLLLSFQKILKRMPEQKAHEIQMDRGVSIAERINEIVELLKDKEKVIFDSLFESAKTRTDLITTFLAILEMAKLKMIDVIQGHSYETIFLIPHLVDEKLNLMSKEREHGTPEITH
jgi:segregation and condensation protein A